MYTGRTFSYPTTTLQNMLNTNKRTHNSTYAKPHTQVVFCYISFQELEDSPNTYVYKHPSHYDIYSSVF